MTQSLVVDRLVKKFRGKAVLDDVSMQVNSGEVVGLFGPNGSGKTTCFYIIVGLLRADSGRIRLNDKEVSRLPIHKRAQLGIAYLPQERSIFTDLTAVENVHAILEINNRNSRDHNHKIALELLRDMSIGHLADAPAVTLSGGEQRRVEIARLLALKPFFVLMDEPFAALSPVAVHELQQIILTLRERGIGVLVTDHNFRETLEICDRAYILYDNQVLVSGDTHDIKNNKKVQEVYSGNTFNKS